MNTKEEADAVNAAIKNTDLPQIADAPNCSVNLLMGIQDVDGVWHTDAVVRELTGEDEEALSGLEAKTNVSYGDYMTALLSRAVVSVGNVDVQTYPSVVDELVVADRDLLFVGIVRATYGAQRKFTMNCTACGGSNDIDIDLTDGFPVEGTTEEIRKPRQVILRNRQVVPLKYPNGADSRFVAKYSKTTAEQNTALISRCALVDVPDRLSWAKKLGVADRNLLVKELFSKKFGPQAEEVNAPCGHCGEEISLTVDWVSLLFG